MGPIVSQDLPQNSVSFNSVCEPLHSVTVRSVLKELDITKFQTIFGLFFLKKLNSFDEDDFFICAEVEYAKCFSPVKRRQVNCNVFWQQLENFERSVIFCANIYSNTNLFCENSRLNSANFTERVVFCVDF